MTDTQAATELEQYIENDADLHRQQHAPILKNLATKKARGQYKHALAVKLFGYLVESGAKKYAKAFGSPNQPWHKMFDVPTRKRVAEELTKSFEAEHALGNYDNLLPKKYQKEETSRAHSTMSSSHARKKSMADYEAEGYRAQTWYLADSPYSQPKIRDAWQRGAWKWQQEQRALRPAKAASSHARKKSAGQLNREIAAALGKRRSA